MIPPNAQMEVRGRRVSARPAAARPARFTLPIDHFFRSLAGWARSAAVGMVLSGTASDGAGGLREIKSAGGITLAQAPGTAKYDGMPRAAIATGMVDLVLSPREIAARLGQIGRTPTSRTAPRTTARRAAVAGRQAARRDLHAAAAVERHRLPPVQAADHPAPAPPPHGAQRGRRLDDYLRLLQQQAARDPGALAGPADPRDAIFPRSRVVRRAWPHVLPQLLAAPARRSPIRVWVPGCATGEEAYSLAIVLIEALASTSDAAGSRCSRPT